MFYVKSEIAEGVTLKTNITSDNVFTICPDCGEEIQVDLSCDFGDLLCKTEGDLESTRICCMECSNKILAG